MSEEAEPTVNGRPVSDLKVVELKEELSKRGLSRAGNKNVLYDRLKKFLLDETDDGNGVADVSDASQVNETPGSPPANPLIAEYYAKQEAALREARKDAEAALRSSSGDEASSSPKKISSKGRRGGANSAEADESVVERRTTRSKTRSDTDQEVGPSISVPVEEVPPSISDPVEEVAPSNSFPVLIEKEGVQIKDDELSSEGEKHTRNLSLVHEAKVDEKPECESLGGDDEHVVLVQNVLVHPENDDVVEKVVVVNVEREEYVMTRLEGTRSELSNVEFADLEEKKNEGVGESPSEANLPGESHEQEKKENEVSCIGVLETAQTGFISVEACESVCTSSSEVTFEKDDAKPHVAIEKLDSMPASTLSELDRENMNAEHKRRWKETSSSKEITDKDVVTVSVSEDRVDYGVERSSSDESQLGDKLVPETVVEGETPVLAADDKDEELDYEEAMEHASPLSETSKHAKREEDEYEKDGRREKGVETSHIREDSSDLKGDSHTKKHSIIESGTEKEGAKPEEVLHRNRVSPARYPVSEYLLIRQLTRPFTVKQLQSMLAEYGALVKDSFWIDSIKSKCIVKYSSKEEATVARANLHNLVWPAGNPKELKVDFIDEAGFKRFSSADRKVDEKTEPTNGLSAQSSSLRVSVGGELRQVSKKAEHREEKDLSLGASNRGHSPRLRRDSARGRISPGTREELKRTPEDRQKIDIAKKAKTADELFQKTKTQPAIYFAPLTDEQMIERMKRKNVDGVLVTAKRGLQLSREERHKEDDTEKDGKYHSSPTRRQKSPVIAKRRRPSRSRSPRRP